MLTQMKELTQVVSATAYHPTLFEPGRNVWAAFDGQDADVFIDAEDYFAELFANIKFARKQIFILGWDFDSTLCLVRQEKAFERQHLLAVALKNAIKASRDLQVYILCWNPSAIFFFERELFQKTKISLINYRRIHFQYDDQHPLSGSHHQKIVMIDDRVAYSGGIDVTRNRWDDMEHESFNKRRRNITGAIYQPMHDVQVGVGGKAAIAIGELCRERWLRCTGNKIKRPVLDAEFEFSHVLPESRRFKDVFLGISRTCPAYKGFDEIREVENLYVKMLREAREYIYIENQYYTSRLITNEIIRSLERVDGPQIIMILTEKAEGLIEKGAVFATQNMLLSMIKSCDRFSRFNAFYPFDPALPAEQQVKVHSKIMAVDDQWLRIGSSNLTNRSMGLDTECDITVDARKDPTNRAKVRKFVLTSIAHFTGLTEVQFETVWEKKSFFSMTDLFMSGSLHKQLRLWKYDAQVNRDLEAAVGNGDIFDLDRPIGLEKSLDETVYQEGRERIFRVAPHGFLLLIAFCILVAVLWKHTPISTILTENNIFLLSVEHSRVWQRALFCIVVFTIATVLFCPLNLLTILLATVLSGFEAVSYVVLGALSSATVGYGIGRWIMPNFLSRAIKFNFGKYDGKWSWKSVFPLILFRMLPIAPFTVVNLLSGSNKVPFSRYFVATFVGLLPGTICFIFFQKSLFELISHPTPMAFTIFAAFCLLMFVSISFIHHRLTRYGA